MDKEKKQKRYQRLYKQIQDLIIKSSNNPLSNMATINAVLYHKMETFFWCGFYLLQDGKLQVGPYQGALACINQPAQRHRRVPGRTRTANQPGSPRRGGFPRTHCLRLPLQIRDRHSFA